MEGDADMDTPRASSIFSLYQEGLASNHVLQLCFLRRRAPRRLQHEHTRIEDEFVLPRPVLKIANLLPSADIPLEQLVVKTSSELAQVSSSAAVVSPTNTAIDKMRESARKHFLQPRQAAVEEVARWSDLTDSDWRHIHQSLQRPKKQQGQDDEMTGVHAQVSEIADVCWMLEHCRSDAFVSFVWDHLLIALLQQCVGLSHHSIASLSPKDFRAKVRSRNLRQIDDAFGAQAELALISVYWRQRNECGKFP